MKNVRKNISKPASLKSLQYTVRELTKKLSTAVKSCEVLDQRNQEMLKENSRLVVENSDQGKELAGLKSAVNLKQVLLLKEQKEKFHAISLINKMESNKYSEKENLARAVLERYLTAQQLADIENIQEGNFHKCKTFKQHAFFGSTPITIGVDTAKDGSDTTTFQIRYATKEETNATDNKRKDSNN